MKKLVLSCLFLTMFLSNVFGQSTDSFEKAYDAVSVYYSVPDNMDKPLFSDVNFRFGWSNRSPYVIAIQFTNRSYADCKFKFAVKDATAKKMVVLDKEHNTSFSIAAIKATSLSGTWAGEVDDPKDSFVLEVWDADGNEYDKVPISIADQQ